MKPGHAAAVLSGLMAVFLCLNAWGACLTADPGLMFDTSSNCASQPSIDRVFGAQRMTWNGTDYLLANIGNDIAFHDVSDDTSPRLVDESRFRVGNVGDSDYDLWNFSVCDDCPLGVANYKKGTVFFELGVRQGRFGPVDWLIDWDARLTPGAFVFTVAGEIFLVAEHGDCMGSALYRYNSVDSRQKLHCLTGTSRPARIVCGLQIGIAIYMTDTDGRVHLYRFEDDALEYVDSPWMAYGIKDSGMECSGDLCAVANSGGLEIWNVSDPLNPNPVADIDGEWNRAAITGDVVTVAKKGFENSEKTFRLSDLQEVAADFWAPSQPWNWPGHHCSEVQSLTASEGGSTLFLTRYSRMQRIDVGDCLPADDRVFADGFESGSTTAWSSTGG